MSATSMYGAPSFPPKNAILKPVLLGMLLSACAPSLAATPAPSRLHEITDADTWAWWQATKALSNDSMEGRDIGSTGYDRAAKLVASRFAAAGLKSAGDNGRLVSIVVSYQGQVHFALAGRGQRAIATSQP